eukprot:Gb_34525 [translate_table: standard]
MYLLMGVVYAANNLQFNANCWALHPRALCPSSARRQTARAVFIFTVANWPAISREHQAKLAMDGIETLLPALNFKSIPSLSRGTIGRRKGVISTHRNYIARIEGYGSRGDMQSQSHISFCLVPMFHIYGFFYTASSITVGATSVTMPKFDLEEMFSPVQKYRQIGLEGAPLEKNVIEEVGARFLGIQVTQVYELTESSDAISFTKMNEGIRNYGITGSLSANVEE